MGPHRSARQRKVSKGAGIPVLFCSKHDCHKQFQDMRTASGATRHTSAHLLLFNPTSKCKKPSSELSMEIQLRSDYRVFQKHYFHPHETDVKEALEYGSAPSPWKRAKERQDPGRNPRHPQISKLTCFRLPPSAKLHQERQQD